jgi:NAD(P)-dependent dehydrogenase (short-subunit alcohol dehydrogenase family)
MPTAIITGASRGIGRGIALLTCELFGWQGLERHDRSDYHL